MKRTIILNIFVFALTLIGCTLRDDVNIQPKRISNNYDYIQSIISANSSIFGNVLILDSIEAAYELLDDWSTLSYQELRQAYSNKGFYSQIIESNIVYDSLFDTYMDMYGIEDFSTDEGAQESMFLDLESVVFSTYQDFIHPHVVYDSVLGRDINIIEPDGDFDLPALTNEHGIFIADTIVYKLYPNGQFLSFYLSDYPNYAGYEYYDQTREMMIINGCDIPDLPVVYFHDYYRGEPMIPEYKYVIYSANEVYRMNISLSSYAHHSWFYGTTTLCAKFQLKNYKLGCFGWFYWLTRFQTTASCEFIYEAYVNNNPHDVQAHLYTPFNESCKKITQRYIIARFTDNYFSDAEIGFIGSIIQASNGRISFSNVNNN